MERLTRTFKVDKDIAKHYKENFLITSMSDWINEEYRRQFMNVEAKTTELKEITKRRNELLREMKALKKSMKGTEILKIINKDQLIWIKKVGVLRVKKTTEEGVYRYFCNEFKSTINRKQFGILLRKFGGK